MSSSWRNNLLKCTFPIVSDLCLRDVLPVQSVCWGQTNKVHRSHKSGGRGRGGGGLSWTDVGDVGAECWTHVTN